MWALWERENGNLAISAPTKAAMKKPVPLENYLSLQGRFRGIDEITVGLLKEQIQDNFDNLARGEAKP
jgi:pyruvate ferredoxin oxidoreductase beta subunit